MTLHYAFSRYIYWPLTQTIKGEYAFRALNELSESQWNSQEEIEDKQWQLVRRTVTKAAQEVPYYREAYARAGWDFRNRDFSYQDFLTLPKLEKEDMRDRVSELLNPNYYGSVTTGTTSGSTGQSLKMYYTTEHESYSEGARWRAKGWWGVEPGCPQLVLWGRPYSGTRDRLTQRVKSYGLNTRLFSAFDIREASLQRMWKTISRFEPKIIYGYPSGIFALAEFLRRNRIAADNLGLNVIMITAEASTVVQRTLIEEVFGAQTANEYGCSETGGFVYECSHGSWHISSELTFIEFLRPDGTPVSEGEAGEVFLTHLRNDYMPLIRYRVGDLGSPLSGTCSCGRGLPRMGISVCKENDVIRLANGETYMSGDLNYISKTVMAEYPSSILQFRVRQKAVDIFEIEIIPGVQRVDRAEARFSQLMKEFLGNDIDVQLKRVPYIERERSGKLRYFVSDLP
ncbi:MAG: adenylyltransferase [Nitrospirales bacterium]|nr:MAG: adenylyltransferase [Nitrospirales bacterium]